MKIIFWFSDANPPKKNHDSSKNPDGKAGAAAYTAPAFFGLL